MSSPRKSTKTRLIEAALDLFAEKGVTETTTKAVAERAQVNEVTLFRKFGSKHRLMLAVIEDSAIFAKLVHNLVKHNSDRLTVAEFINSYARESLKTLAKAPELIRSIVGEAGSYPLENRLALGKGLTEANRYVAEYLERAIAAEGWETYLSPEQIISLLNELLVGYFVIESTCEGYEGYELWDNETDFLDGLVGLFLRGIFISPIDSDRPSAIIKSTPVIEDLPASLVRSLFKTAKKFGKQEYAFVYALFGAGLSVEEILNLKRVNSIIEPEQHLLQINHGAVRQVPLNQWILGYKYGSASNNPLTQWLKTRHDEEPAIFINEEEQPIDEADLRLTWAMLTEDLLTPQETSPSIEQAKTTWCMEMLVKGIDLENLSILSGLPMAQLQQLVSRVKNKIAIEQVTRLGNAGDH
ncbi:MAG: TetR family transcriptional regulator [Pleurocapsa sp.]